MSHTASVLALRNRVGASEVVARSVAEVAGAARPGAARGGGTAGASGTARTHSGGRHRTLTGLESTARANADGGARKVAVSSRPSTSVHAGARQAIRVARAALPVRGSVVTAHRGVVGIEQAIGVRLHVLVARRRIIVGTGLGHACPKAGSLVVGEVVVLANHVVRASRSSARIATHSLGQWNF